MILETKKVEISDLIGKTLKNVNIVRHNDEIIFETECGEEYIMYHHQECCESVYIEDVIGDIDDLIGSPLVMAELETNEDNPSSTSLSNTWTFYKLATEKGYVTIRWYGESNGYYSEKVDFYKIIK